MNRIWIICYPLYQAISGESSIFIENLVSATVDAFLANFFHYIPHENNTKPKVFWCSQGAQNWDIGQKCIKMRNWPYVRLNPLSANPTKCSNTLKRICPQFADELFACVWPFSGFGSSRVKIFLEKLNLHYNFFCKMEWTKTVFQSLDCSMVPFLHLIISSGTWIAVFWKTWCYFMF